MDQRAVEEQHVAGLHIRGHRLHALGRVDQVGGEALGQVGLVGADQVDLVRTGHDHEAAVFRIHAIDGGPGGDAGAGGDFEVEIVLVQGLAARAGGLEVEHALAGDRFLAEQLPQHVAHMRIEHHAPGPVVEAVGMDHPGVSCQGIASLVTVL